MSCRIGRARGLLGICSTLCALWGVLAMQACDAAADSGTAVPAKRARRDAGLPDAAPPEAGPDAAEPGVRRWTGTVQHSDIRLGAVVEDPSAARIFFCGGRSSYASSTRWIVADVAADGSFEFDDAGWRVQGQFDGDALSGELRVGTENADTKAFAAAPIDPQTIAGLYEGPADCGRVGLIVTQADPDAEPSGQGACVGAGHDPEQVNPILPIALERGEIRVMVGDVEARVHAAAAEL